MIPEFLKEGLRLGVGAGDGEASADDVLGDDLGDATGKRVVAPGIQALGEDVLAGILRAVEFGSVEGSGTDKEFIFRFVK